MSRTLAYSMLDVFAERPLEGNPLAVFHDGRSLSDDEMQALARETNLAETTFILPDDPDVERREGVRVRIFTTAEELPFAGHPTLGTASWLYFHHPRLSKAVLRGERSITLRLNVGPVPVRFKQPARNQPGELAKPGLQAALGMQAEFGVQATMRQNDPVFGATHDREAVARAIGMRVEDLSAAHAPQTVSTGIPFCIVPLRSLEVAQRLQMAQRDAQAWLSASDAKFFYCIAPLPPSDDDDAPRWHARMQFYSGEDPATGSAAGCCICWLVRVGLAAPGQRVVIEQGIEIARPSRIVTVASMRGASVHSVLVSGRTIPVAEGRFFLP